MSAYSKACAARCQWCAKGCEMDNEVTHWVDQKKLVLVPCTAPMPEQFMEEQAARIAELESQVKALSEALEFAKGE